MLRRVCDVSVKPPGAVSIPRIIRHQYLDFTHLLCFRNKERGGSRIDSYHIQVSAHVFADISIVTAHPHNGTVPFSLKDHNALCFYLILLLLRF